MEENGRDKVKRITKRIRQDFYYDEHDVDITLVKIYSLNGKDFVFWVANETGHLGIYEEALGVDLIMRGEQEDSWGLDMIEELLETAAKYEDLSNS